MSKRRLGLDIDGVLFDWEGSARFLLREYFQYDLPISTDFNAIKNKITGSAWSWLWDDGIDLGLFRHGNSIKGCHEALRRIADKWDIIIITHRPARAIQDTMDWLSFNKIPATEVHIQQKTPKSQVKCHLYIDDSPTVVDELIENTYAPIVLFDQPWNHEYKFSDDRVTRMKRWSKIAEKLNV